MTSNTAATNPTKVNPMVSSNAIIEFEFTDELMQSIHRYNESVDRLDPFLQNPFDFLSEFDDWFRYQWRLEMSRVKCEQIAAQLRHSIGFKWGSRIAK